MSAAELPPDKERIHARAVRLEWITIAYLTSAVLFIYLTLGASQAMKAAWLEDLLSLIPAISFLVASRVRRRPADEDHPYGWHRIVSVAFLVASLALFVMGAVIFLDSLMKLISFEHPTISTVRLFGNEIWLGWLMLPALAWSAIPAAILGRMKLPVAQEIHDKVLYADAKMNKADWLTATAAALGVLGIGIGWWWADPLAAMLISVDIFYDGLSNTRHAFSDLMDTRPTRVDRSANDPLPARVETEMRKLPWVEEVRARMREEGHVYYGEIFVVPSDDRSLVERIASAGEMLEKLDWRIHDVVITPVRTLDRADRERAESEEGQAAAGRVPRHG